MAVQFQPQSGALGGGDEHGGEVQPFTHSAGVVDPQDPRTPQGRGNARRDRRVALLLRLAGSR